MKAARFSPVKFLITACLTCLFSFVAGGGFPGFFDQRANAHSVAQVQTALYFAPETVQMLKDRVTSGGAPGLKAGDIVSYIIQFSPLGNGATVGSAGYLTDYIPANTEVVKASIIQPNGTGGFVEIAPNLPGPMSNGWGSQGQHTFSNWSVTNSLCTAAGKTATNCTGSLAQVYADTGIFYSTDDRTKVDYRIDTNGRISQGTNGYKISPTAAGQLNPYLGQNQATTHNKWDADQTNSFGSIVIPTGTSASGQPMIIPLKGRGATPYNAGSAVAGPDAGYQLDNTGAIGPWQRIAYPGSRVGNPTGPATSVTGSYLDPVNSATAVVGNYTSAGRSLSLSNPLPANTKAVRWALGRLNVGEVKYANLQLRLTADPPASGLLNNSEVFGGDSAEAAGKAGNDAVWRYHIPSVADSNSNLYLYKEVICVFSGATCVPSTGSLIPASAKIRYRIAYLNTGNATQTNVVLSDTLPTQTAAGSVSNLLVVSGPNILPIPLPSPGAGGATITFGSILSLGAGLGGEITMDVQTSAVAGTTSANIVTNQVNLISTQMSVGIMANAVSAVTNIANLNISKTVMPANAQPGDQVTYTLKIENTGLAAATNLRVYDFLPTSGGSLPIDRFNFVSGTSIVNVVTGITSVLPTTTSPPNLVPFIAQNREQVYWNFGATSSLAAGASFNIQFKSQIGSAVPNSITAYTNDARVIYATNGFDNEDNASAAAPVMVAKPVANLKPDMVIVKRITGVIRNSLNQLSQTYIDVTDGLRPNDDNASGWPTLTATAKQVPGSINTANFSTFLEGITQSTDVSPALSLQSSDYIDYRVYFLSNGGKSAQTFQLCDFIPAYSTYEPNSLKINFNGNITPVTDSIISDTDGGYYLPITTVFPNACKGNNHGQGAVVVNISKLPASTGAGSPIDSFGYMEFRVKFD
jgi:uncharacterized repeat protein (TIGR01451 family)